MSTEQEIINGEKSKRILDDPLVQEFLGKVRENIISEWRNSGSKDTDGRERCHQLMKVVDEFERHFKTYIETGRLAREQLSMKDKIKKVVGL